MKDGKLIYRELSEAVIGGFYVVYNALGFGFLESVYASAISLELRRRGLSVPREVLTQVYFLGQPIATFRLDMVVNDKLIIEIKASKLLVEPDRKQLFNYLRATDYHVGLLLHFGPEPAFERLVSTKKPGRSVPFPPNPRYPR